MFQAVVFASTTVTVGLKQPGACRAAGKTIGDWSVDVEQDRSSDKMKTVATTADGEKGTLAIRCLPHDGLSILVDVGSGGAYGPGASLSFKYKADGEATVDGKATASGAETASITNPRPILETVLNAQALHVWIETAGHVQANLNFSTRRAGQALTQILADCPEFSLPPKSAIPGERR